MKAERHFCRSFGRLAAENVCFGRFLDRVQNPPRRQVLKSPTALPLQVDLYTGPPVYRFSTLSGKSCQTCGKAVADLYTGLALQVEL